MLTFASFGLEPPADKFQQCATLELGDGLDGPSYAMVSNCAKSFRYICRKGKSNFALSRMKPLIKKCDP